MKLLSLRVQDFMGVKVGQITPDGSSVVIGGNNGQGKSSMLQAMMCVLVGKRAYPTEPVRNGQREAVIEVELSGDTPKQLPPLKAKLTIQPNGSSELELTDSSDGTPAPSPQTLLKSFLGHIGFDPHAFLQMSAKDQSAVVERVLGLDFDKMREDRVSFYDKRTHVNRRLKEAKAQLNALPPKTEVAPIDTESITKELGRRQKANEARAESVRGLNTLTQLHGDMESELAFKQKTLESLTNDIKSLKKRISSTAKEVSVKAQELEATEELETDGLLNQLATANEVQQAVFANQQRDGLEKTVSEFTDRSNWLTDGINAIDKKQAKLLSEAKWPVDGLAIDENGEVLYNGLPLTQVSQAEGLRISTAIGAACNPTLKAMIIQDGALLDEDSRKLLLDIGKDYDVQLLVEVVGESGDCTVVMRDGNSVAVTK